MKVKLQANRELCLVKAVKEILNFSLKEAKDLVVKQTEKNCEMHVIIDSEKTEEEIKAIVEQCGVACTPAEPKQLQKVTDEDLGVSIYSIDEMSIGWQRTILLAHKQATRVLAGLCDAKCNVTEKLVIHEGDKVTMLTINKTFPSGTRKKDLEIFEHLTHAFIQAICTTVSLEDKLEKAKQSAIEAFNELQNYE